MKLDVLDKNIEKMIRNRVLRWSKNNLRKFPWRKKKISAYEIFIAEMLLKRTTAKAAASIFNEVLTMYPSIKKLSNANEDEFSKIVESIGYKKRALEMLTVARYLQTYFNGKFPCDKEELLENMMQRNQKDYVRNPYSLQVIQ